MINEYLRAGYPGLYVLTYEPLRAEKTLTPDNGWHSFALDCQKGIRTAGGDQTVEDTTDPQEAVSFLNNKQNTILFTHNLHLFMDNPELIQTIQNGTELWKSLGSCLIILAPEVTLPQELQKLFTFIDFPLPTASELYQIQEEIGSSVSVSPDEQTAYLARGLTEQEAENAYALSLVKTQGFSPEIITQIKASTLKRQGLLEFWEPTDISDVGGLSRLKTFIDKRINALKNPESGLPKPKGLVLCGIPGTGKSLASKAVASMLNWPLLRLDIGALKGSLVGESEKNIRLATKTIEAFGSCVVWLDEAEKALAGSMARNSVETGDRFFELHFHPNSATFPSTQQPQAFMEVHHAQNSQIYPG